MAIECPGITTTNSIKTKVENLKDNGEYTIMVTGQKLEPFSLDNIEDYSSNIITGNFLINTLLQNIPQGMIFFTD